MGTQRDRPSRQTDPSKLRVFLRAWLGKEPSFRSFNEAVQNRLGKDKISRSAVHRVYKGKPIDKGTWEAIEKVLGVSFDTIELEKIQFKSQWELIHPASYSGKVWLQVVAKSENRGLAHPYTIRWGPWKYSGVLNFGSNESEILVHMKGDDGLSVPIFFAASVPCCVFRGQGDPPAGVVHDINNGWTFVQGA